MFLVSESLYGQGCSQVPELTYPLPSTFCCCDMDMHHHTQLVGSCLKFGISCIRNVGNVRNAESGVFETCPLPLVKGGHLHFGEIQFKRTFIKGETLKFFL